MNQPNSKYHYRKLLPELVAWKNSQIRKPLILRGARQVGKTSLVRLFGETNFKQIVEINLEKVDHRQIFEQATSVQDFLTRAKLLFEIPIIEGETLLFIDEIQASKTVLELLRFFAEELPKLHVVAAGSLLEAKLMTENWTIPVGRVDYLYLFPMTFSEFLQATGRTQLANALAQWNLGETNKATADLAKQAFKEYMLIGGMPEIVSLYANNNQDLSEIRTVCRRLTTAYAEDVIRYVQKTELAKHVEHVIQMGPKLAGSTFSYEGFAGGAYRGREMAEAIGIVEKVMLLKQVQAINSSKLPLLAKLKRPKKLLWLDIGLVNASNDAYADILVGEYAGKMMEQIVGQSLMNNEIYYWARNRDEGSAEVDFVAQLGSKVVAFEVKSGHSFAMRSMTSLLSIDPSVVPVRVSFEEPKIDQILINEHQVPILVLPVYLLEFWQKWVVDFEAKY